jgi:hypothetical protein
MTTSSSISVNARLRAARDFQTIDLPIISHSYWRTDIETKTTRRWEQPNVEAVAY